MNLIEKEQKDAAQYKLRTNKDGLLDLTRANVALVEAMIANDSDYIRSGDVDAGPTGAYKGSTAYWMTKLKYDILSKANSLKNTIMQAVLAVDRDNSTHISADGIGPEVLTARIYDHRFTLLEELKDRERGFKLIAELSEITSKEGSIIKNGKAYHPRENYSFATKFCHYACLYMFVGKTEQDNYSIYDNIVKKALPDYLSSYNIHKADGKKYKESDFKGSDSYPLYSRLIDQVRGDKISRNGFDHLLWYYHKAR